MNSKPGGELILAGKKISKIGFGTMHLPHLKEPSDAKKLLRRAFELGINVYDTANFYGDGTSNKYLYEELGKENDVIFITKIGAVFSKGKVSLSAAQKPEQLRQQVLDNLKALHTDHLDIVFFRRIAPGTFPMPEDQNVDFKDQLEELLKLRNEGLIKNIALSTVTLEELKLALPHGIVCVQNYYNLADRKDEPILELCRQNNIPWMPYYPLGGSPFFTWVKKVLDIPIVKEIAKEMEITPAQVALAWLLQHYDKTILIPGTTSIEHLEQNVAVGNIKLSPEAIKKLDSIDPQK